MYQQSDLERSEQILALRYLGLPLTEIKEELSRPVRSLRETLGVQRQALQAKRARLDQVIRAVSAAEEAAALEGLAESDLLRKVIEVMDMQADVEVMKKHYSSDESWERHREHWEHGPSIKLRQFCQDCVPILEEDPASERAQAMFERWWKLNQSEDRVPLLSNQTAWMDRANWPAFAQRWVGELRLDDIGAFFLKVAHASRKRYFDDATWTKLVKLRINPPEGCSWNARVSFFPEVEESLQEQPEGPVLRALRV